jgi:hypothetical protein
MESRPTGRARAGASRSDLGVSEGWSVKSVTRRREPFGVAQPGSAWLREGDEAEKDARESDIPPRHPEILDEADRAEIMDGTPSEEAEDDVRDESNR